MSSNTNLPVHYQTLYTGFIRFACIMSGVALIAGILFQESTRKIPFNETFTPGLHWESVYHLALLHGHVFLIGVLIPLAVLGMLQLSLLAGGRELSVRALRWGGLLYRGGVWATVALMLYKGYHYVLSVRTGTLDFTDIEHSYFGGLHILRAVAYGSAHTAMAIGLLILVISIFRSLPGKPRT